MKTPSRPRKPAVHIYPNGREVCSSSQAGRAEYRRRREYLWDLHRGLCCLCGLFVPLELCTFEHFNGRGMNGSKRDDRVEGNGIAHLSGNAAKGSISYHAYMLKPLEERRRLCQGL